MVVNSTWQSTGMRSEIWGDGGIAVFRAQGDFAGRIAQPMLEHAQETVDRWRTGGLVADYSGARLQITEHQLVGSIASVIMADSGALALPTALVVRPDDLTMWHSYARMMAKAGIVRGVFTDHDKALRWTRRQAEVFNHPSTTRRQTPASGR